MSIPKTREEAISKNVTRYNTGAPCKKGHIVDRYTTNGGCVDCVNPKLKKLAKPMSNQFALTSLAHLPPGVRVDDSILLFFNICLQDACADWYARYVKKQGTEAVVMGQRRAKPLSLEQLDPTAAAEVPLDLYIENGWTPAQLVQHGYASVRGVEIAPAFEVPVIPPADPNVC